MNLKSQLKFYLEHRGITAAELARRSGVSKQTVSLWLAGSEPRKLQQLKRVADFLAVSVDHLCFGTGLDATKDRVADFDTILGSTWVGGMFEVRIRRVKESR